MTHPELARQAVGWDPSAVTAGSGQRKAWKCDLNHEWDAIVKSRSVGRGCPICAGKKILPGFNDLATIRPDLAGEAFGWDPSTHSPGSHVVRDWKCGFNHVWRATIKDRSQGTGCPICSGTQVLAGFNDLATLEPELSAEAFGWDPRSVTQKSGLKREWKCANGHRWEARVAGRSNGRGCPICSGQEVLVGFNDLGTLDPYLSEEAFDWDPTTVTRGSKQTKQWKCEFGHTWRAAVKNRSTGAGCPTCSKNGFNPNAEGWIYFLGHEHWQMFQIGITNFPDQRLGNHRKLGWELIELRGPMDGLVAREWEKSILQMLKRHEAKLGPKEIAGKFDGYTEAWLTHSFEVKSLRELMDQVMKDENIN